VSVVNEHSVDFAQINFPSMFMCFMGWKTEEEVEMLVGGITFNISW